MSEDLKFSIRRCVFFRPHDPKWPDLIKMEKIIQELTNLEIE